MQHDAVHLIRAGKRITGVQAQTPDGLVHIPADLVIGCDGRHSTTRKAAGFEVIERGVPIDVLWFRLSRRADDPEQLLGNLNYGKVLVLINRGEYFQAGLLIQKGSFAEVQSHGLEAFRQSIRQVAPYLGDRVEELKDWDQIKLLTVQINRLRRWYRPGLLCIGDAAHAMSPAGGVGINLAIQDAVATANLLADPLREGRMTEDLLAQVQRRREFPTRVTQQIQVFAHKGMQAIFQNPGPAVAPWQLKAIVQIPVFPHLIARLIGMGVRPEHFKGARKKSAFNSVSVKGVAIGIGLMTAAAVLGGFILRNRRGRVATTQ
jgi:2-polyprenyl-6-methoxyphenol hydroxylase-like FAD-dependent oxidoreductase